MLDGIVPGLGGVVLAGITVEILVLDRVATGVTSTSGVEGRADLTIAVADFWQLMAFE